MTTAEPLHVWTGLRWFLDSNAIDDESRGDLLRLAELGWVWLSVTDTAWVELGQNPTKAAGLSKFLTPYDMAYGTFTIEHSALDMSVIAGEEDVERHRALHALIWPNANYEDDGQMKTRNGKNRFRDSMHVDTAIKYRGTGLVTQDKGLLESATRVASEFDGFAILNIQDATERSKDEARRVRHAASIHGKPDPSGIPAWPE